VWPPKKILCPTDFSEGSEAAISWTSDLARQFGAVVYLVHVIAIQASLPAEPVHSLNTLQANQIMHDEATRNLQDSAERLQDAGLTTRTVVAIGDAASAIVETAEQQHVDLIVIATYGRTGWRRLAFGSVTEKVVRTATCPVLTIRGKRD
jgi:nucleotide-binding universal stress UspA family protein